MPDKDPHAFLANVIEGPLFVSEGSADLFLSLVRHLTSHVDFERLAAASNLSNDDFWNPEDHWLLHHRPYNVVDGVLQIPIMGALLSRFSLQLGTWATGYTYIQRAFERGMDDGGVNGIALVIDSPGGQANGLFELVDKMFERRDEKPIRAFIADKALSAGYALGSVGETVTITRSGTSGGIGVVAMHTDLSGALEQRGIRVTFIKAGKHKTDGNRFEPLSREAAERFQVRVDKAYEVFVETVARNRNMSQDVIRDTEALVYESEESVEVGLADRVGALEDEMVTFTQDVDPNADDGEPEMAATKDTATAITQADVDAQVSAAAATAITDGAKAERKRTGDVMAHDNYQGREAAAQKMLADTELSADQIIGILATMPKKAEETSTASAESTGTLDAEATAGVAKADAAVVTAQTHATKTREAAAKGADHFKKFMDSDEHPNVGGVDDGTSGDETADDKSARAGAELLGAYNYATGDTVGVKSAAVAAAAAAAAAAATKH